MYVFTYKIAKSLRDKALLHIIVESFDFCHVNNLQVINNNASAATIS